MLDAWMGLMLDGLAAAWWAPWSRLVLVATVFVLTCLLVCRWWGGVLGLVEGCLVLDCLALCDVLLSLPAKTIEFGMSSCFDLGCQPFAPAS